MKICIVCAPGVGDLIILNIASHHLAKIGHEVITISPHHFGKWISSAHMTTLPECDAVFLQYDNTERSQILRNHPLAYTFFGSYKYEKHGPLNERDFICDLNSTMVDNIIHALAKLFSIQATSDNNMRAPKGLIHRKFPNRIAIHTTSGDAKRNWPMSNFLKFATWAKTQGLNPILIPQFPTLEELCSFIYESGYFLGNDSGPGHIASCLKIPHLIIGKDERHMRHWRPGWGHGSILTPPKWVPNWKGFRIRENQWRYFITTNSVIKEFTKLT